jgi:two-component system, OmpR family, sensor histidine kinase CiaH
MKKITVPPSRSKTVRLALSYLAIIMVLGVAFSIVFYVTSSNELGQQLAPPSLRNNAQHLSPGPDFINTSGINPDNGTSETAYLQQRVDQGRNNLMHKLVVLNIITLLLGAGLSYYLARRTLEPIEAAMDAQSRFASDASHELRTPLTVMQIEIEDALRRFELSKPVKKLVESNLEEVKHLKGLSEELLRLARQPQGLELQSVWADEVASIAMNRVVKSAQAKGMAISDTSPHVQVLADKQNLAQVIVILLDNAIKYGTHGTTIHIEGHTDNKHAYLAVRDEGPGIERDDLPHIFDRFYRSEQSRKQYSTGHGLGLSIAQTLINQQHGSIAVDSTPGKGSTFTIKLPINREK